MSLWLFKEHTKQEVLSVVTVHNILKKNGLVCPQKRMRRVKPVLPIFDPKSCNEVWNADYKGKFLIGNKYTVIPLPLQTPKVDFFSLLKDIIKKTYRY